MHGFFLVNLTFFSPSGQQTFFFKTQMQQKILVMTESDKNDAKVIIIKRNQVRSDSLVDLVRDTKLAGEKLEQLQSGFAKMSCFGVK